MKRAIFKKAEQLATRVKHVFVATADANGLPHMAAAGKLVLTRDKHALVTEWFCPGTVANLEANPRLSLVVWDPIADVGYQLIGELREIKDLAMLDGYAPKVESKTPVPQVERQLLVRIDQVLEFKRAPHTDVEE